VRAALSALGRSLSPSDPMGPLNRVQLLAVAGDAFVTISLAGTLFFSISLTAARSKVILYLLLTMAPFAVVGPFLSPLSDRVPRLRRVVLALSLLGRAVLAVLMAGNYKSVALFPEAFGILVLSKLFFVTRSAVMPSYLEGETALALANARIAILSGVGGFLAGSLAAGVYKVGGTRIALVLAGLLYLVGAVHATLLPAGRRDMRRREHGAMRVARAGYVFDARTLLNLSALAVVRGAVGFTTFLMAFGLRRAHAPTYWYGVLLAASAIGSLLGSAVVGRTRRRLGPSQMIALALLLSAALAGAASTLAGYPVQTLVAFGVGLCSSVAKPSLDAVIQSRVPEEERGRAFGRSESIFQVVWVMGSLLPVLYPFSFRIGDVVIAVVSAVSLVSFLVSAAALRRAERTGFIGGVGFERPMKGL
jgi:MFS family permease